MTTFPLLEKAYFFLANMEHFSVLKNILFLDIETVPMVPSYNALPERFQPIWDKKGAFHAERENKTTEEIFFEKAGIFAEFAKVVTIGVGYFHQEEGEIQFRGTTFHGHDEKEILHKFADLIEKKFSPASLRLAAHNGKEFDFPFLCRRYLINGLQLPIPLNIGGKKPWEINHIDTMEMWKFGDFKNYTSLETLAAVFDIPTSKGDIDGSQVGKVYYEDKDVERIAKYCMLDVVVTAQLYRRLKSLPLLDEKNIHIV